MHLDLSKRNTYQYSAVAEHVGCHGPSSHRMDQVRSAGGGGGDGGHPTIIVFCCAINMLLRNGVGVFKGDACSENIGAMYPLLSDGNNAW